MNIREKSTFANEFNPLFKAKKRINTPVRGSCDNISYYTTELNIN